MLNASTNTEAAWISINKYRPTKSLKYNSKQEPLFSLLELQRLMECAIYQIHAQVDI